MYQYVSLMFVVDPHVVEVYIVDVVNDTHKIYISYIIYK